MTSPVRIFRSAAAVVLASLAIGHLAPAFASTLDEPESLIDGADAVVRVHFDVRVQYQRHAPTGTADLVEIYFQVLGGAEDLPRASEEQVATSEQGRIPGVAVTFPVQPGVAVKKIVARFSRKLPFKVRAGPTSQSIDIVFPGLMGAGTQAPAVPEHDRFAITLQVLPLDQQNDLRPVPGRFQDYTVFSTHGWQGGRPAVELDLGYFDTQEAAEKVARSAQREFPDAKVFDVVKRKAEMLAQVAEAAAAAAPAPAPPPAAPPPASSSLPPVRAPLPAMVPPAPVLPAAIPEVVAPQTAAPPTAPEAPDTDIDRQARALLDKARAALASGNNEEAINLLNQLLLLPPNKFSQEAQELIGVARERAGQIEQARKEYELYLKLFPNGEGATRVRQRLASLAPPPTQAEAAPSPKEKGRQLGLTGSLSQYYYGGKTQVNTSFLNTPITVNQQTVTSTSQSSLVSTLDLTGRYREGSNDARLVLRDSNEKSFIGGAVPGTNRLDSAYVDYRNASYGFSAKVGRQSGVAGGLIGRFDGAIVGYDVAPQWRLTAVGGVPTDVVVGSSQSFEGMSVEAQNLYNHWGGDAFFINQTTDGVTDRRAIGTDVRYFDSVRTLYTMVDYDVSFMSLNAVTLQGTWQLPDQTSFSLLADDRKAPELLTSNALLNPIVQNLGITSINQLLQTKSLDEVQSLAKSITANAKQVSFSVSRPFWASWQSSVDVRLSNVGALPTLVIPAASCVPGTSCTIPGQQGTGNVWTYDFQLTGSNLYSKRDINSFTLTHLNSPLFSGNQFAYTNLTGLLSNRMTVEPSLRYYTEDDSNGNRLTRVSPGLRATYKLLQHMSLESQILYERSKTDGPTQQDTTSNAFYYIGYRYDLQ